MDLLYCGTLEVADERLELPHPRLLQRRFVLTPLAAIRPDLRLIGETRSIAECLAALDTEEAVPRSVAEAW